MWYYMPRGWCNTMEKIKHLFVGIISFVMFASIANASKCEYAEQAEINQEAAGVKISYEEKQNKLEGDNGVSDFDDEEELYELYFTVHITNVTDNLYFKVKNGVTIKNIYTADGIYFVDDTRVK